MFNDTSIETAGLITEWARSQSKLVMLKRKNEKTCP